MSNPMPAGGFYRFGFAEYRAKKAASRKGSSQIRIIKCFKLLLVKAVKLNHY